MRRRLLLARACAVVAVIALMAVGAAAAEAHPLGNFTVNRYSRIDVSQDGILITYVLDLAEVPSVQDTQAADTNHDGVVSDGEWQVYTDNRVEQVRRNLELIVDGTPVALQTRGSSTSHPAGQGDIPLIRIEAAFSGAADLSQGAHQASYRDRNEPSRLGWREIVVRGQSGVRIDQSSVPASDTTDELHNYPDRFVNDPLNVREASWSFEPGVAEQPTSASSAAIGRPTDAFTQLITQADLSPGLMLLALLGAAILGGMHAASPGHGKTVMAAYIVGTRGSFVHALVLGMSVTVSHTTGVLILGVITLLASNLIMPEQLYPWLTLVSAVIVLVVGAVFFVSALRTRGQAHDDHHHHHDHDHDHPHPHPHAPVTWRSLFALGLAGGAVPSASALVVLLSALALGRIGFGLLLIVAFGVGMAVVLTLTGVLLVYASRFVARYFPDDAQSPVQRVIGRMVPMASAATMLLIGVVATVQALGQFGLLRL